MRYQLRQEKLCIQNRYNFQLTHKYKTTKTNQLNLYSQNILYINSFVSYMCEDDKIKSKDFYFTSAFLPLMHIFF